jgi:hypothetical protein
MCKVCIVWRIMGLVVVLLSQMHVKIMLKKACIHAQTPRNVNTHTHMHMCIYMFVFAYKANTINHIA